jgi:hypothetical protein
MECGSTVKAELHCEIEKLKSGIYPKRPGTMAEGMVARLWIIPSHRFTDT